MAKPTLVSGQGLMWLMVMGLVVTLLGAMRSAVMRSVVISSLVVFENEMLCELMVLQSRSVSMSVE